MLSLPHLAFQPKVQRSTARTPFKISDINLVVPQEKVLAALNSITNAFPEARRYKTANYTEPEQVEKLTYARLDLLNMLNKCFGLIATRTNHKIGIWIMSVEHHCAPIKVVRLFDAIHTYASEEGHITLSLNGDRLQRSHFASAGDIAWLYN